MMDADYRFWVAIHRAIEALAKAIETYKIKPVRRSQVKLQKSNRTDKPT